MADFSKPNSEPSSGGVYQDTISLLQEEIQRLEFELQLREDVQESLHLPSTSTTQENDLHTERRLAELSAELANRDETIGLLWEQIQQFEAAEETRRAEWEQIHQWVEEVERRIGDQGGDWNELRTELEAAQRRNQELLDQIEADRRRWNAQRSCLETEIEGLRARLAEAIKHGPDGPTQTALVRENQELRESCRRLATAEAAASEIEPLRTKLQATEAERDQLRQELRSFQDERAKAPRVDSNAPTAELAARESNAIAKLDDAGLSPDARIRALRQHLKEIHEREEAERKQRQLSTRLARLWRRND